MESPQHDLPRQAAEEAELNSTQGLARSRLATEPGHNPGSVPPNAVCSPWLTFLPRPPGSVPSSHVATGKYKLSGSVPTWGVGMPTSTSFAGPRNQMSSGKRTVRLERRCRSHKVFQIQAPGIQHLSPARGWGEFHSCSLWRQRGGRGSDLTLTSWSDQLGVHSTSLGSLLLLVLTVPDVTNPFSDSVIYQATTPHL